MPSIVSIQTMLRMTWWLLPILLSPDVKAGFHFPFFSKNSHRNSPSSTYCNYASSYDGSSNQQCHVPDEHRLDCHQHSEQKCRSVGCCWWPSTHGGSPWCFHPRPSSEPQCQVAEHERTDCRRFNRQDCLAAKCCWSPTRPNGPPWCFLPKSDNDTRNPDPQPDFPPGVPPLRPGRCGNWDGYDKCQGSQTTYEEDANKRAFQTPPRTDPSWSPQYQDYRFLVGHISLQYSPDRRRATTSIRARVNGLSRLRYRWQIDGVWSDWTESFTREWTSDIIDKPVVAQVHAIDLDATLTLEPVDFLWTAPPVNSQTYDGQKGAIVELFGWPYVEIEKECEFLSKAGYMGVKIFPPNEHVLSDEWLDDHQINPWYLMYQPVSYKLHSRSGTRDQLRRMVHTCRRLGIRIYADAVINHMSSGGTDSIAHRRNNNGFCAEWGAKKSTAGSPYYTHSFTYTLNNYTKDRPALEFPAVPYFPTDFHCERGIQSWNSPHDLNYGWLVGLSDLRTESPTVQERIADYLVDLISLGISGLRIDAAKHIAPDDLSQIFGRLSNKLGGNLPDDFIAWLEVIMGGEKELLACRDNRYNYYTYLTKRLVQEGLSLQDVDKIKIWASDFPRESPICGYWILPPHRFAIQMDDHDQQFGGTSRDIGPKGSVLLRERNIEKHRRAQVSLFQTREDFPIRLVLSGFTIDGPRSGIPDGFSSCARFRGRGVCRGVEYQKANKEDSCGYTVEHWLPGRWVRNHRDMTVVNAMRRWMGMSNVSPNDVGLPSHCR